MDRLKHHSLFNRGVFFCSQDVLIQSQMLVKGVLLLYCFNSLLHQLLKFFAIAAFLFLDNACLHSQELRKYYWALGLVLFGH